MPSSYTKGYDFEKVFSKEAEFINGHRRGGTNTVGPKPDLKNDLTGISLSGGGIRSASFNLGFLQALARYGMLRSCDYLSTVSGGGYIGSCVSALLTDPEAGSERDTFPFRFPGTDQERVEVKHVREKSSYLAPKHGLFSMDTWRMIGFFLQTVLLNVAGTMFIAGFTISVVLLVTPPLKSILLLIFPRNPVRIVLWISAIWAILSFVAALKLPATLARRKRLLTASALLLAGLAIVSLLAFAYPYLYRFLLAQLGSLYAFPSAFFLGIILLLYGSYWNINRLTAHMFYRDRLSEAFIFRPSAKTPAAAGETHDAAQDIQSLDQLPLTHIHEKFDLGDYRQWFASRKAKGAPDPGVKGDRGPYHIINATVNVKGSGNKELRGRGIDSFIFSKYSCGSAVSGYQETSTFERGKLTLATAMAISGAAADPSFGTRKNPLLGMVMSFFGIRLGYWVRKPVSDVAQQGKIRPFWPWYFVRDVFGLSRETDAMLNITDGGHYENLGLYELIRRRCRCIVVSDSGADSGFNFQDLANALRRVRIDFGVQIDMDLSAIYKEKNGYSPRRYAVGKILYTDSEWGVLVYAKSTLTGREPRDLLSYKERNRTFPHQSTADQFFDEAQFESYRQLGYETGKEIFRRFDLWKMESPDIPSVFESLLAQTGVSVHSVEAYAVPPIEQKRTEPEPASR